MLYMTDVTYEQLALTGEIVKIFGFKGLCDYDTEISSQSVNRQQLYSDLGDMLGKIDSLFPTHDINVRRLSGTVTSITIAMNILRSLLTYCGVPWRTRRKNKTITIKLVDYNTHFLTLTEASVLEYNNDITSKNKIVSKINIIAKNYFTNIYSNPDQKRYYTKFIIPPTEKGYTLCGIEIVDGELDGINKMLLCGGQNINSTNSNDLMPPTLKWLPNLAHHGYEILICGSKNMIETLDIIQKIVPNENEPNSFTLNCFTSCLNEKCSIKDKPNSLIIFNGMMGIKFHCNCSLTGLQFGKNSKVSLSTDTWGEYETSDRNLPRFNHDLTHYYIKDNPEFKIRSRKVINDKVVCDYNMPDNGWIKINCAELNLVEGKSPVKMFLSAKIPEASP
jgi:hypothetical protein